MTATIAPPLGHVGLNVTDLDRSLAFYESVFGFDTMASSADPDHRWVLLGRDGQISLTLWEQAGDEFDATRAGLHHVAFNVADVDAVRDAEAELRRLGIDPLHGGVVPLVHGGDGAALYFHDPDGTRLEISSAVGHVDTASPFGDAPTCGFF